METRPVQSGIEPARESGQTQVIAGAAVDLLAAGAREAVRWAWEQFGTGLCLLSSLEDATLIDVALRVDRRIPIVFLDNGYHFPETLQTLRNVESFYGITVEVVGPEAPPNDAVEPGECCDAKVALLDRALAGRSAWMSGIRRSETDERADTPLVAVDRRGLAKVSPLAQWSDEDEAEYRTRNNVITNPLLDQGYASIGCRPCTSPSGGADRSGRWAGTDRTECGLHT